MLFVNLVCRHTSVKTTYKTFAVQCVVDGRKVYWMAKNVHQCLERLIGVEDKISKFLQYMMLHDTLNEIPYARHHSPSWFLILGPTFLVYVLKCSGIPEAETFGQKRKFSAFGLWFRPPKFKAEYGRMSNKVLY